MADFDLGVLLGMLIGEGYFGGDETSPEVTVRMHIRHAALFDWLLKICPGSRLWSLSSRRTELLSMDGARRRFAKHPDSAFG